MLRSDCITICGPSASPSGEAATRESARRGIHVGLRDGHDVRRPGGVQEGHRVQRIGHVLVGRRGGRAGGARRPGAGRHHREVVLRNGADAVHGVRREPGDPGDRERRVAGIDRDADGLRRRQVLDERVAADLLHGRVRAARRVGVGRDHGHRSGHDQPGEQRHLPSPVGGVMHVHPPLGCAAVNLRGHLPGLVPGHL